MIVLALLVLGLVVTVLSGLIFWKRKKAGEPMEINYYAFFVMGICFLPLGAVGMATKNYGLMGITGLGLAYMGIGLANRDKWPADKRKVMDKFSGKKKAGKKKVMGK